MVAELKPIQRNGLSLLEIALQFIMAHPAVTCPIPSMKNVEQAKANCRAADAELSDNELSLIKEISAKFRS